MRKQVMLALGLALLGVSEVQAARIGGFGLDAFNRAVSSAVKGNAVFSPASFEIDSVTYSEAFGALTRAKYAETMGVLTGLEGVYQPIYEELSNASEKRVMFTSARAFCVPDERKVHAAYRQWMQKSFAAEAFTFDFKRGAECWFRSRMDGDMEDFELPNRAADEKHYSYFDLVSMRISWAEAFPTNNTREVVFHLADGKTAKVKAMCDLRLTDVWARDKYTAVRIPMADESWFCAMLPKEGVNVGDIRRELTSLTLPELRAGFKSVTEGGLSHGATAVVIPKMDITTECELKNAFTYFKLPFTEMERIPHELEPRYMRQVVRFRLDEQGLDKEAIAEKPVERIVKASSDTTKMVLNRPFLFFIYHEPTSTILVSGQFTGR